MYFGDGDLIFLGFKTVNFVSLEPYPKGIESWHFFIFFPLGILDRSGSDFESLFGQFLHICLSNIIERINFVAWKERVYLLVLEFLGSKSKVSYFNKSNLRL
jgi:hypothetical protein